MKKRKLDKFDFAIYGIFICAIIVSFSHTIELYKSSRFDISIEWMNTPTTEKWLGKDFFNLALFATLAAEFAFTVGLWGLYEAFKKEKELPGLKYKSTWTMFLGGLVIVGWSNIGGTVGYDYLFGDPVKGIVLGLSIPYFVLNSVLVNFSRSTVQRSIEQAEQKSEHEQIEQKHVQNERVQSKLVTFIGRTLNTYMQAREQIREQIEQAKVEQNHVQNKQNIEQDIEQAKAQEIRVIKHIEQDTIEQIEQQNEQRKTEQVEQKTEQSEHGKIEQRDIEQIRAEQNQVEQDGEQVNKQIEREQWKQKLYIVNGRKKMNKKNEQKTERKIDQAVQCALELMARNEPFTVRELAKRVGCSPATAQNAMNKLKEIKQA